MCSGISHSKEGASGEKRKGAAWKVEAKGKKAREKNYFVKVLRSTKIKEKILPDSRGNVESSLLQKPINSGVGILWGEKVHSEGSTRVYNPKKSRACMDLKKGDSHISSCPRESSELGMLRWAEEVLGKRNAIPW